KTLKNPSMLHSYNYALQNPLKFTDVKGLQCGPGQTGDVLIPDLWFEECCIEHDSCYAGEDPHCHKTREECDNEFCNCTVSACQGSMLYLQCLSAARTYCNRAKEQGGGYYNYDRKCDCESKEK
ncbi:MAG: hypothetical protein WAU91_13010, partial [Desulfatitalea sp.]